MRGMILASLGQPMAGFVLDLDALPVRPVDLKAAVIMWLVKINLDRIKAGLDPIITYDLVMKCPVWQIVKPPITRVELTKDQLFNQPSTKPQPSIGTKSTLGSRKTTGTIGTTPPRHTK